MATSEPRGRAPDNGLTELDLAALLEECQADLDLRERLARDIGAMTAKLPRGMAGDGSEGLGVDSVLTEARTFALGSRERGLSE